MDEMIYGIDAVAKHFEVSTRTIYKWIGKGFPNRNRKEFPRRDCELWHHQQKEAGSLAETDGQSPLTGEPAPGSKAHWSKRDIQARAEIRELELAKLRKELMPVKDFHSAHVARIVATQNGLRVLPRVLPPLLVGKDEREMSVIIGERVNQILRAFSRKAGFVDGPVDREQIHRDIDEMLAFWEQQPGEEVEAATSPDPGSGDNEKSQGGMHVKSI
jgi:transposase